jgi:hypothetical protein
MVSGGSVESETSGDIPLLPRKTRLKTLVCKKNSGGDRIQRWRSGDKPLPGHNTVNVWMPFKVGPQANALQRGFDAPDR